MGEGESSVVRLMTEFKRDVPVLDGEAGVSHGPGKAIGFVSRLQRLVLRDKWR